LGERRCPGLQCVAGTSDWEYETAKRGKREQRKVPIANKYLYPIFGGFQLDKIQGWQQNGDLHGYGRVIITEQFESGARAVSVMVGTTTICAYLMSLGARLLPTTSYAALLMMEEASFFFAFFARTHAKRKGNLKTA
jgi:hypothetical protein